MCYHKNAKIVFSGFLMMSSLIKVSIMTQMDINFCVLLFYILLRNVVAFDKALPILYGFFNLRISKKTTLPRKGI